ncbi:hypothetical protein JDS77_26745 [Bacillus cereus group sp. N28]|uniref:hypothetical protein n=1 Tax=Bacillus cereus group TaxID=86661 RepID=UPI0018F50C83|nr:MULTISPECIES: hypothetical protein [Bacillus cereus group]MBJ7961237.1 hypothetical protein [Bacillus cereus group sp. N28]CAH2466010.1 hypothetical protein ACOSJ1_EBGNOMHC_05759 [Bacillus mycoides KBAB4]
MKKKYMNRKEFIQHVSILTLGYYAYKNEPISFPQVAEYLNTTTDNLRLKKQDTDLMNQLSKGGIVVERINNTNHFVLMNN